MGGTWHHDTSHSASWRSLTLSHSLSVNNKLKCSRWWSFKLYENCASKIKTNVLWSATELTLKEQNKLWTKPGLYIIWHHLRKNGESFIIKETKCEAPESFSDYIKIKTSVKTLDTIAFVPSICFINWASQFPLIQTLVKSSAKQTRHARLLYNNNLIVPTILSPRRSKSNVARKKGKGIGLRLILKFSISIRNPLVCPKVYFLLPFCPDQGFSNICLISHLHKFAVIIFQRQSGGISRQEMGNIFWWDLIKETEHLEPQHIKQLKQQRRETHVVEFSSWGGILCHNEQEENYNHRRDGGLKACEESVGCN